MESTETQTTLCEHNLKLLKSTTSTTTTTTTTKVESKIEELKSTESAAEEEDNEVNTNYADVQYEYNVNLLGATMNKVGDWIKSLIRLLINSKSLESDFSFLGID